MDKEAKASYMFFNMLQLRFLPSHLDKNEKKNTSYLLLTDRLYQKKHILK